ncbi:MAG TPA: BlaI/MecI/CopY family transcriptional regulator [Hyphomonadaceae bacterium]|nr:BlaI/MecI/CopY family transcriptional regulator [Hyphomonadaceae bacterium]
MCHMATANRSELAILKQLWMKSPKSAREVQDAVFGETGWSYSTTRTLLTRMEEKGLLKRSEVHGVAVYSPALSRVQVLGAMARELTRQVLDIKGALPASMFADSPHLSEEDLAELDAILNADDQENGQ